MRSSGTPSEGQREAGGLKDARRLPGLGREGCSNGAYHAGVESASRQRRGVHRVSPQFFTWLWRSWS